MGAGTIATFDNDDALDWGIELADSNDLSLVEESLTTVNQADDEQYLEAPACACALAAVEVVAALLDGNTASLPQEVGAWVTGHGYLDTAAYRQAALQVIQRCAYGPESELRELWDETPYLAAWLTLVEQLKARLAQKSIRA